MKDKTDLPNEIAYWALDVNSALHQVSSSQDGLSSDEASRRVKKHTSIKPGKESAVLLLFRGLFKSPVTILLMLACILSFFLGDRANAVIIILIVLCGNILSFWQEHSAGNAVARLLGIVRVTATILRDNLEKEIPMEQVVIGDVVILNAGDIIPADCLIIDSNVLFVDEAAFTGETFPVEKFAGIVSQDTVLANRTNSLLMGSHVISGTARALVIKTGAATEFGKISENLKSPQELTAFEIGIKKFSYLLMQITMLLVIAIFAMNVFLEKPPLESFLFTLAIAIGLTPQLLPAIITVNLSRGARNMAARQVIVKRLNSIENFGSMDVLCSDKTGTLTEGKAKVFQGTNCFGNENAKILELAHINASLQQGYKNPIDEAITEMDLPESSLAVRLGEIPYDFIRKRLTLQVSFNGKIWMITKGAVNQVLSICSNAENETGEIVKLDLISDKIEHTYQYFSGQGYRTLAVAYKEIVTEEPVHKEDENDMVFAGFITLYDAPKKGISETISNLGALGINLKVITGDNLLVAKNLGIQIGIKNARVLSGDELKHISDQALVHRAVRTDIFAEVEPNQKERIILALKKAGKVVGYVGDGVNDASALHAGDVGISVNTAVDVAREAADIVLLDHDLNVLIEGVKEGRRTFANTQKYIFMATSANFGNMFSMAGASMFLTFLPLLPRQILLTNLLTDFPALAISTDEVDEEWIKKPRRWDITFIKKFMIVFGLLSSVFDYVTFAVLLRYLKATEAQFQTGWFMESVVSATIVVLVIRTRKPFFASKPGRYLLMATLAVTMIILLIPFLPLAGSFGFVALPASFYFTITSILAAYILSAELLKHWFYKK